MKLFSISIRRAGLELCTVHLISSCISNWNWTYLFSINCNYTLSSFNAIKFSKRKKSYFSWLRLWIFYFILSVKIIFDAFMWWKKWCRGYNDGMKETLKTRLWQLKAKYSKLIFRLGIYVSRMWGSSRRLPYYFRCHISSLILFLHASILC